LFIYCFIYNKLLQYKGFMKYKEIADRLENDIISNKRPGDRLPGLREIAKAEGISLLTARNVYLLLTRKGLITTRQGSGTFVAYSRPKGPIDLSCIAPPEEFLFWIGRHLSISPEGLSVYDPPQGYEPLIMQARQWLEPAGNWGMPIITAGSQQALFLAGLSLLRPGDLVAVENPGYTGARRIFESLGATVKPVPYMDTKDALDHLRDDRIRMFYTMPQAHIPTGSHIPQDVRDDLLSTAEVHDFYILEDDPLSDLTGIRPLKVRDKCERVIYIKSLSNILGPGLRIAFAVLPEHLYTSMLNLKEIIDLSISGILQRTLYEIMASGDLKRHITRLKSEMVVREKHIRDKIQWPSTSPCLWINTLIPGRIHMEKLLRLGVRIMPGDIYGTQWADHIRISLMSASREDFFQAMQIIHGYFLKKSLPELKSML